MKELPTGAVGPEASLLIRLQLGSGPLLVRVDSGFSWAASLEGGEACGLHETLFRELLDPFLVSGAPDAPWFARGESDRISPVVDALTHAVDPSEAERLIDRLRPGNAWFP